MSGAPRSIRLAELAERFSLSLQGDSNHTVSEVGTLESGGPQALSFFANRAYRPQLATTRAGAVILAAADADACPVNCLVSTNPYLAYARVARLFDHRPIAEPGIHPTAVVHPTARIGRDVHVGAHAVIAENCEIGNACCIGPGCVIAAGCRLGEGSRLVARVFLGDGVQLGQRVLVHPGAVIGADGFGLASDGGRWEKVPQLGSVQIGDDCEIGANSCIDRGAIGDTVLEEDVRVDNLCQIGHNCRIGAHSAMAGMTGISGSTTIGRNCLFAGRSGTYGHIEIADRVTLTADSVASKSISTPGATWSSTLPARPIREWQRTLGQLNRLDQTLNRLRRLLRGEPEEPKDE